jgi:hypothetical protein
MRLALRSFGPGAALALAAACSAAPVDPVVVQGPIADAATPVSTPTGAAPTLHPVEVEDVLKPAEYDVHQDPEDSLLTMR